MGAVGNFVIRGSGKQLWLPGGNGDIAETAGGGF